MAEILLSLTIIGVVAAITLPSLTGNINERTWNTQRKALYARISQAVALMPSVNGYGTILAEKQDEEGNITQSAVDTAAETFITDGLSKVLKINNVCDSEHLSDCGLPSKINPMGTGSALDLSSISTITGFNSVIASFNASQFMIKSAAFETVNGESILTYYYPNCIDSLSTIDMYMIHPRICANFVYDLNGSKGPNTVGKDIGFISVFYPTDSIVVAPMPLTKDNPNRVSQIKSIEECKVQDTESRLPNLQEIGSLFYNKILLPDMGENYYWSGTVASNGQAWLQSFYSGTSMPSDRSKGYAARCIKR